MPRKAIPLPDAEYLRSILLYVPATGVLFWRQRPREHFATANAWNTWNSRYADSEAGAARSDGYQAVTIDARIYLAHRLIWKIVHGTDPVAQIDHRRLSSRDNNIDNLRAATNGQNGQNRRCASKSLTGFKGVYPVNGSRRHPYMAQVHVNGSPIYLGVYETAEEAHAAYCAAARKHFGEFFNPG